MESTSLSRPRQLSVPTPVGQGLSLSADWCGGDWHDSIGHLEKSKWKTGIVYVQNMCVCIYNIHISLRLLCSKRERSPVTNQWKIIEHHLKRANGAMAHSGDHSVVDSKDESQKKPTVNPRRTNNCIKVCGILSPGFFGRLQIHSLMEVHNWQQKMNGVSTNWVVSTFILILRVVHFKFIAEVNMILYPKIQKVIYPRSERRDFWMWKLRSLSGCGAANRDTLKKESWRIICKPRT